MILEFLFRPVALLSWWLLALLSSLALTPNISAQERPIQLKNDLLHNTSVYDTAAINRLVQKGKELSIEQPDSAKALLIQALKKSEASIFSTGIQTSFQSLIDIYFSKGEHEQIIELSKNTLLVCLSSEQLYSALPVIYSGIATLYSLKAKYELAAKLHYQAILIAEKYGPASALGGLYNNLTTTLIPLGRFEQALYYLDKAEKVAREEKLYVVLGPVLLNKSGIYARRGDWLRSNSYLNEGLEIAEKYKLAQSKQVALLHLGTILYGHQRYDQALEYFSQAAAMNEGINPEYVVAALVYTGSLHRELGDFGKAIYFLQKALTISQQEGFVFHTSELYSELSLAYKKNKQFEQALNYYEKYSNLKDSFQSKNVSREISQLEIKYRTAEKDKEIIQNKLRMSQQQRVIARKNIWIIASTSAGILLIAFVLGLYRNYRHKQLEQKNQIKILQQGKEITVLKAMMKGEEKERSRIAQELHDGIGGMLAAVNMNVGMMQDEPLSNSAANKLDRVTGMLQEVSAEVRKTAHNLMPDVLTRHHFQKALLLYCENISSANKLQIEVQFQGELNWMSKSTELLIYRLSQELIQNILKHAQASYAAILIKQLHDKLSIIVEDNGVGFDMNDQTGGFGLQNLQFRVQALLGSTSIMSAPGKGTTVHIDFEIEKLNENFATA